MSLTTAQLQTLKAAIVADSALNSQPMNSDGAFTIALELNKTATPDFIVWRSSVAVQEIMQNGFDWTRVDNMVVGKARIWEFMTAVGILNPAQANVRAGINEAFPTAANDAMRLAIFGHCQRLASRFEELFATGAGTTTTNAGLNPATMALEGPLQYPDVEAARSQP